MLCFTDGCPPPNSAVFTSRSRWPSCAKGAGALQNSPEGRHGQCGSWWEPNSPSPRLSPHGPWHCRSSWRPNRSWQGPTIAEGNKCGPSFVRSVAKVQVVSCPVWRLGICCTPSFRSEAFPEALITTSRCLGCESIIRPTTRH